MSPPPLPTLTHHIPPSVDGGERSNLVLILNFGSQYTHFITRLIQSLSVFSLCISGISPFCPSSPSTPPSLSSRASPAMPTMSPLSPMDSRFYEGERDLCPRDLQCDAIPHPEAQWSHWGQGEAGVWEMGIMVLKGEGIFKNDMVGEDKEKIV